MPAKYTQRLRRGYKARSRHRPSGYQVKARCGAWTFQANGQKNISPVSCPRCLDKKRPQQHVPEFRQEEPTS